MAVPSHAPAHLWRKTPLVRSTHLSDSLGCNVYLKLENLHPSHSFKYRGISLFAQRAKQAHGPDVHLVIASSGNAGLAAACAARLLGVRCTVYITEDASAGVLGFLTREGAEAVVGGRMYVQALRAAGEAVKGHVDAVMVPSYDDPVVWEGHASMVHEIQEELGAKPRAIFASVGGGGLLGGLVTGTAEVGWDDVPIVTLETHGMSCFYQSVSTNPAGPFRAPDLQADAEVQESTEHGVRAAHLPVLASRASSLGATAPSARVLAMALRRRGGVTCVSVPDEMSMCAAVQFAEDHKMLVELACSTTLTPAYSPEMFAELIPNVKREESVVFVVCGGYKISLAEMAEYREIAASVRGMQEVKCNGERWKVPTRRTRR